MRLILICCLSLFSAVVFGQNIKLEIADYSRKIDDREYATFQFVRSSYSSGRTTIVFITSRPIFLELTNKLPLLYNIKQEYTDVWVLGITGFDPKNISDIDKKIISVFFEKIIKYRNDNDLFAYTLERLEENKIIINTKEEICKHISCRTISWK